MTLEPTNPTVDVAGSRVSLSAPPAWTAAVVVAGFASGAAAVFAAGAALLTVARGTSLAGSSQAASVSRAGTARMAKRRLDMRGVLLFP